MIVFTQYSDTARYIYNRCEGVEAIDYAAVTATTHRQSLSDSLL